MTESSVATVPGNSISDAAIVARATELVPLLREQATLGSETRQLTPEVVEALDEAGIFHLLLPPRLGGPGATLRTVTEALAEVARGDGSAAWVANLLAVGTGFVTTFSAQAQDDVFGKNPKARASGSFSPGCTAERVDGGYLISGRWPYSTGCFAADWAALGVMVESEDGGEARLALALVPADAFMIEPSWFVTGMKGTGSDTIVVENHIVPEYRVQFLEDMLAGKYKTPYKNEPLASISLPAAANATSVAVHVGLGRHALEITRGQLPEKMVVYTMYSQAKLSPTHQIGVANAATSVRLAALLLNQIAEDTDQAAAEGQLPDLDTRARIRNDIGIVAELVDGAIGALMTANGAGAFAEANLLSRIWQDSAIITRHAYISPELGKEAYGRRLLGNTEPTMIL